MPKSHGTPLEEDKNLYWKNNFAFKWLRFFNLLEPGRAVLSLSKALVWINIVVMLVVLGYYPDQLVAVIGASASSAATMLNYAYRRHIEYQRDTTLANLPPAPSSPTVPSLENITNSLINRSHSPDGQEVDER